MRKRKERRKKQQKKRIIKEKKNLTRELISEKLSTLVAGRKTGSDIEGWSLVAKSRGATIERQEAFRVLFISREIRVF